MYRKVVVPLDGSKLAETALLHLEEIAKQFAIPEVLLVSVTQKVKGDIPRDEVFEKFVPERPGLEPRVQIVPSQTGLFYETDTWKGQKIPVKLGKMAKTADEYLDRIAASLEQEGLNVTTTVLMGNPAEEIVRFAKDERADLIIMASTGKPKISRWDMSHIAEKVIRETRVPVLLVKPPSGFRETKSKRRGMSS